MRLRNLLLALIAFSAIAQTPDDLQDESTFVLTWKPPPGVPVADIKGFNLHWGPASRAYTNSLFFGASNTVMTFGPNIGIPTPMGTKLFSAVNMVRLDDSVGPFSNESILDTMATIGIPGTPDAPVLAVVSWLQHHSSTITNPEPPSCSEVVYVNDEPSTYSILGSTSSSSGVALASPFVTDSTIDRAVCAEEFEVVPIGSNTNALYASLWTGYGRPTNKVAESLPQYPSTWGVGLTNIVRFTFPFGTSYSVGATNWYVIRVDGPRSSANNFRVLRNSKPSSSTANGTVNGVYNSYDLINWRTNTPVRRLTTTMYGPE